MGFLQGQTIARMLTAALWVAFFGGSTLPAQPAGPAALESCFGVGKRVGDAWVGPARCRITSETRVRNQQGAVYDRLEMEMSGTLEGYAVKQGPRIANFTDVPELALGQKGHLGPYYHGIGVYQGEKGSGLTLLLPRAPDDWNGKLFVTVHGGTRPYQELGELVPRRAGRYNRLMGANHYAGLMIDKGYAVAHVRRLVTSSRLSDAGGQGEVVTLDDGSLLPGRSYGNHVGMIRDWTRVAARLLESRWNRSPSRTYFYGISSGAQVGRLINYSRGANQDPAGNRVFDGLLLNDNGGGWHAPIIPGVFDLLPVLFAEPGGEGEGFFFLRPSDRDHLDFDEARRRDFVPQIDIRHRGDPRGPFPGGHHLQDQMVRTYLLAKQENARLLLEKGLGPKTRTYEVIGSGHFDAGYLWPSGLASQNLDLSGFFDALIEVLDGWVDAGVEPPPTRSDPPGPAGSGEEDLHPVLLPEVACPTGIFHEFPAGLERVGVTGFQAYLEGPAPAPTVDPSAFAEGLLEPVDGRGQPVDMNHNGIRDRRETLTEAWRRRGREGERYGTLAEGEVFTWARHQDCVRRVAGRLFDQRLLSRSAMEDYIRRADHPGAGP